MNNETLVNELTGKDEQKATAAAKAIVETSNIDAFSKLADKMEYLFDFIKANVNRRLESAVTEHNFKNIFSFLNKYSPDLEDFIAGTLSKYANEDLTDEMLELLENGNDSQKTYAAKYFSYIPDTIAAETLSEYAFCDDESLAYNSAYALGKMKFENTYNFALEKLNSDDDFDVLKAVKFLVAYGNKNAITDILKAMKNSAMAENIAGEIPFLESLPVLLNTDNKIDVLFCVSKILSGLGEILPLSQVFSFEMYEILSELIEKNKSEKNSLAGVVLLKALNKFEMLCENDEYTFDEDKNTKAELNEINNLLKNRSQDFWNEQKELVKNELTQEKERALSAIHLISEMKIHSALDELKKLVNSDDEVLVCESVCAINSLGKVQELDKTAILAGIKDDNKKAIIENCF